MARRDCPSGQHIAQAAETLSGMVPWDEILPYIADGDITGGKTAAEYAAFWGITKAGARARLELLLEKKIAVCGRRRSPTGQTLKVYRIEMPKSPCPS